MIPTTPVAVGPSEFEFPPASSADRHGVVGIGADLAPSTLVHAYRCGIFPMPMGDGDPIAWWSPPRRGVLELGDLKVSRSLRASCRRYRLSVNSDFDAVIENCAGIRRDGGWIDPPIIDAYRRLHRLGWAHSVETWQDGELVGGLYGVQIGGLFAGESMFHVARDASKVALVGLVSGLEAVGAALLDVQWATDHLRTLGVVEISRSEYLKRLPAAIESLASSLALLSGDNLLVNTPQFLERTR